MSSLIQLIHKDFILLNRYLWIVLLYIIIFSQSGSASGMVPGLIIVLVVSLDLRTNNQQLLVTLPVKRSQLVRAKYISSMFFGLIGLVITLGVQWLSEFIRYQHVDIDLMVSGMSLLSVLFLLALYIPLSYWLGPKGAQYLNVVLILVMISLSSAITGILNDPDSMQIVQWLNSHQVGTSILGVGATALLLVLSYIVSVAIYSKQDL